MKKLFLALLSSIFILNAKAELALTFATEPSYPPFEITTEKGELIGFDIDIVNALCEEMQATCQFKTQSFDSLITDLKFKKFDAAISAIDITEARAKQVSFTAPYFKNSATFLAIKGKATPDTAKIVGVQNGSTFQQYLMQKATQYQLRPYVNLQTALLDLKNGRIDMIFGDTPVLAEWLKDEPQLGFTGEKIVDPQFFGEGYGIAIHKSNIALLEKLNKALSAIQENGKYQSIYHKWMADQ